MQPESEQAVTAMDWLTFIASIVGSMAWPASALLIAFLFRSQIKLLLERVSSVSVGDNT